MKMIHPKCSLWHHTKASILLAAAMAVLVPALHAQASDQGGSQNQETDKTPDSQVVWAPFVSQLRLAIKNPFVRLTWTDVPDFNGSYLIYRHTAEINSDTLANAQLAGMVPQGEEYFNDTPPKSGDWYYAVLTKGKDERIWSIFVPFRNVTINPVKIQRDNTALPTFTEISRIQTEVVDKKISVSFQSSLNNRQVIVYRSSQPIAPRGKSANLVAVFKGTGRNIRFDDSAIPGVTWYYGAADMEADQQGIAAWVPGESTTPQGTEIPLEWTSAYIKPAPPARTMPLPILTLPKLGVAKTLETVSVPTEKIPVDSQTLKSLDKIIRTWKAPNLIKLVPALLPSDKMMLGRDTALYSGETKILLEVLQKTFRQQDYPEAIRLYRNTLLLNLGAETQAKARFYLGQALYLSGQYREALLEFLVAEEQLKEYAQVWAASTLEQLEHQQ